MKNYEMTQQQLDTLLDAMKPVPMIMLQCGAPLPRQQRANDAWKKLGDEMGFDWETAGPNGKGDRFFSAEPKEVVEVKS